MMHCKDLAASSGMQTEVCLSVQISVHESNPVQSPGFTLVHANSSELDAKVASYRESTCETGSPTLTVNLLVSAAV